MIRVSEERDLNTRSIDQIYSSTDRNGVRRHEHLTRD
jgi:hypothetical protein